MSICSCCLHRITHRNEIEVGHWWNNEPYLAVVCSESCKDKLWKMLQDKTWMIHRPVAMFPETSQKIKGPNAMTDKQFGTK
jgi:hypothetical protein